MYKITIEGMDYVNTNNPNFQTVKRLVKAFENCSVGNYEIDNIQYLPNELTIEQRLQCLIDDGLVEEV